MHKCLKRGFIVCVPEQNQPGCQAAPGLADEDPRLLDRECYRHDTCFSEEELAPGFDSRFRLIPILF